MMPTILKHQVWPVLQLFCLVILTMMTGLTLPQLVLITSIEPIGVTI